MSTTQAPLAARWLKATPSLRENAERNIETVLASGAVIDEGDVVGPDGVPRRHFYSSRRITVNRFLYTMRWLADTASLRCK